MTIPRAITLGIAACTWVSLAFTAHAGPGYGIYDARTMAMGGVSVASANNDNAQFYNSALLAFNEEIEERTQDGRLLLPLLVPEFSESAVDIEEISQDGIADAIPRSISGFNASPGAATAQTVVDATANLDAYLARLDDEDLRADFFVGMGLSEPGKWQGAGFFAGARLLAGGQSTISEADRAILADYQEGLLFIASDGTQGAAHPELFDANGALIDPSDGLESTASAIGVLITEVGVAMSKQLQLFGSPVAAGITFKVLDVETFEDTERLVNDRISIDQNDETETHLNLDVGLVKEVGSSWRLGLAIKDVVPYNYKTSLGTIVRLRPRPRLGASYETGQLQLAMDVDLVESEPLGRENPTQDAAVGAEWRLGAAVKLRAGYRYDVLGNRDGILSAGIGSQYKRLVIDAAYAQGSDSRAAALQFGIAF